MFTPKYVRINRRPLGSSPRDRLCETRQPLFSWGALHERAGARQSGYRARVLEGERPLWDSGFVATDQQEALYAGPPLENGGRYRFELTLTDEYGQSSETAEETFYLALVDWTARWIAIEPDEPYRAAYFRKEFVLEKPVAYAVLYACGLGYHALTLNGQPADDALLDPAHTDYTKICQYAVIPEAQSLLRPGANCIGVVLGEGWRRNPGPYLQAAPPVDFFGRPQLLLMLDIVFTDGEKRRLASDGNWACGRGPIVANNLFDGETYDARERKPLWNLPGFGGFGRAALVPPPGGKLAPMLIPPVRAQKVYPAISLTEARPGLWVADFGQNIAGVLRLRLPRLAEGQRVTVKHMEFLDEDGELYTPPLRGAKARDTYVASGDERDLLIWQPTFTYHGFRYATIEGAALSREDIEAVALYTDLETVGAFACGNALVDRIQHNIVMTERANMHSILTDCPQRDERMGWLNDATVRFEETPYNFEIGAMFPKIVGDIRAIQRPDGAIGCTAPFVYGNFPADPVCSSYLVAALEALMHTGNRELIGEGMAGFAAWEECLLSHSVDYIVDYSYYGDWAGPAYACAGEDGAVSAVTPGTFMSTGYSYYNCTLLSRFARELNDAEAEEKWRDTADKIRTALLDKWYDAPTATVATGSQACQAFALWLGILPEADRPRAAKRMRDDLVQNGYRFTTGNLCTRYLFDMLAEYGYVDEAWTLITREEYPSFGYMIEQEATTIWERFELKKNPGMNSHNHPMYGAVGSWFYAYIAGLTPTRPGWRRFRVKPYFPTKLLSARASLRTPLGDAAVRWVKRYGETHLYVTVPFGAEAEVDFGGETRLCPPGTHHFRVPCPEAAADERSAMSLVEAVARRRSVRRYLDKPVPEALIAEMLKSAQLAPSGGDGQSHRFGVVRDPATRRALAEAAGGQMWLADAPLVFACCARLDGDFGALAPDDPVLTVNRLRFGEALVDEMRAYPRWKEMALLLADGAPLIPAEHIALTAAAHGLGSCIVGYLDVRKAGEILRLPDDYACLYLLPVGYPAREPSPKRVLPLEQIAFYEKFQ